jgi:hypothetical protein
VKFHRKGWFESMCMSLIYKLETIPELWAHPYPQYFIPPSDASPFPVALYFFIGISTQSARENSKNSSENTSEKKSTGSNFGALVLDFLGFYNNWTGKTVNMSLDIKQIPR